MEIACRADRFCSPQPADPFTVGFELFGHGLSGRVPGGAVRAERGALAVLSCTGHRILGTRFGVPVPQPSQGWTGTHLTLLGTLRCHRSPHPLERLHGICSDVAALKNGKQLPQQNAFIVPSPLTH